MQRRGEDLFDGRGVGEGYLVGCDTDEVAWGFAVVLMNGNTWYFDNLLKTLFFIRTVLPDCRIC